MLGSIKPGGFEGKKLPQMINKKAADVYEDFYDDDDDSANDDGDDDGFYFDFDDKPNKRSNETVPNFVNKNTDSNNNLYKNSEVNNTSSSKLEKINPMWPGTFLSSSIPVLTKKETDLLIDFKQAIINQNVEKVKNMISNKEVDINTLFNNGWSPLMYAVSTGSFDCVKFLVSNGASVNQSSDRITVLMSACACKRIDDEKLVEIVKYLVENGADYRATDKYCFTPLMFASREGNLCVVRYLISLGAEINQQDENGWTALLYATNNGHIKCVYELLKNGANTSLCSFNNTYATDIARNNGFTKIKTLLERCSKSCRISEEEFEKNYLNVQANIISSKSEDEIIQHELVTFLKSAKLSELVDLFNQNNVTLQKLVSLNDDDLIKLGLNDSKIRQTLLDEICKLHKESWKPSSLMPIKHKQDLNTNEIGAMLTNISRHLDYIQSTIQFVKVSLNEENFTILKDGLNSCQTLQKDLEDALQSNNKLSQALFELSKTFSKNLDEKCQFQGDYIHISKESSKINRLIKVFKWGTLFSVSAATAAYLWKNLLKK